MRRDEIERASLLVVTPQRQELAPLVDAVGASGCRVEPLSVGRLEAVFAPSLATVFAVGGHGKVQFGLQTQHLIDHAPGLQAVICAGAAGALSEGLAVGDVVVATAIIEHDFRLKFVQASLPRWETDEAILESFRRFARDQPDGCLHFGPIASGDEDVLERVRAAELARETGALCVAWEGAGGARAATFSGLSFAEVRGITDAADANARASYRHSLRQVMARIGQLLVRWRRVSTGGGPSLPAGTGDGGR